MSYQIVGKWDLVVVGGGPAGLACAFQYASRGIGSVCVFEGGRPMESRDAYNPIDAANGVGGAGLMSDGKFSFGTAGTASRLLGNHALAKKRLVDLMSNQLGIRLGFVVDDTDDQQLAHDDTTGGTLKPYPCAYVNLDERRRLTAALQPPSMFVNMLCTDVDTEERLAFFRATGSDVDIAARYTHLVVATGRFGPLTMSRLMSQVRCETKRAEFGVRIEGPVSALAIQKRNGLVDPKISRQLQPGVEWRTFCWCDDAEVAVCSAVTGEFTAWSGRKVDDLNDPTRRFSTGLTNLGFMLRITGDEAWHRVFGTCDTPTVESVVSSGTRAFSLPYGPRAWAALRYAYKHQVADLLVHAIGQFIGDRDTSELVIHGPCYEGMGRYPAVCPKTAQSLSHPEIRFVGDCAGDYRGLVPALVAGFAIGDQI